MKNLFTSVLSCICLSMAVAQPTLIEKVESKDGKVAIAYEKWKLSNGLTVLLHEDHSDPVINLMVTYKVGSARESMGKSGFAHFFEHMMFEGSKHLADKEHFKIVSTAGGEMNGFTERDKTTYFETMPSNYLETALYLESDRMGFLLDSLTTKKFEIQRATVKNEKSQNVENQPYAIGFEEEINKILYPDRHPYSWPVIGYVDDLNRASVEDVRNFFLRWYGPNNAILSIAGDFSSPEALKMVDKYFGTLKQCPEVKKMRVAPNIIATDKYAAYKDKIYFPLNLRVYPTVPQYHRDEAALDLLGIMMGGGNNSIIYKNFVKSKLAIEANVNHQSSELAGEFAFQIIAYVPDDFNYEKLFNDLDAKVKTTIEDFEKTEITDDALQRAKAQAESQQYSGMSTVFESNFIISKWERLLGHSSTITDEIERYNKVTKEDISRVFNKYIKGTGAAIINTYPIMSDKDSVKSINPHAGETFPPNPEYANLSYAPNPDNFDRSIKPTPGPAKSVKIPDYYNFKMKNGINVIGTVNSESPQVTIVLNIEGGSLVLPPDMIKKMGVAELTANLLNEGTKNYTTEKIAAELEKIGATISFSANKYNTSIRIECLKKYIDATLKVLEEKLLNPGFRDDDFKLAKKQYKEEISNQKTNAQLVGNNIMTFALYGSTLLGLPPTWKSVDNIELKDLQNYYNNYYSPSVTNLIVVGDIDEKTITPKLEFLNKWQGKEVKIQPIPEPVQPTEPQFFISDKSFAPSTFIALGNTSLKFDATGDYYKNQIANFCLGGTFNSRLNMTLREEKGWTYGIYSYFAGNKYTGRFAINSSVKRSATTASLMEILNIYSNYVDKGVTDAELEFTKNSLRNEESLKYEASYQKAEFLSNIVKYNLEKDYSTKQNQILKDISKDEVNQQIKKYFATNKLTTVLVGDKSIIESQIDKALKDSKNKEVLSKVKLKKLTIE
ncbi:MAG: pitrilysin family protein [Bacteroidota bacterium]